MDAEEKELRELLAAEPEYSSNRFFKALALGALISLSLWGVVALVLFLSLRPTSIQDGSFMSVVPPGAVAFCLRHAEECTLAPPQSLSATAFYELDALNYDVNRVLRYAAPSRTAEHGYNYWRVLEDYEAGPCIDYVLTKRHRLIARGFPAGAFSVGIVREKDAPSFLLHAVLLAKIGSQLYVLDSQTNQVTTVDHVKDYVWLSYSAFGDLHVWRAGMPSLQSA